MDVEGLRAHFPALQRTENDRPVVFADGPAGTQVPRSVIDAMAGYFEDGLSNLGGVFGASRDTESVTARARDAVADLVNCSPDEVAFGQNMTSITLAASRAIARTWSPGDNVVVTRLDHDANVSSWMISAAEKGATVRHCDIDPADCSLRLDHLADLVDARTRLVAVTRASNAVGTLVDVAAVAEIAHARGALVYVDAVHAAPHVLLDVAEYDCDFLAASSYKFFGPHVGLLYGKQELLDAIEPVRIRPAPAAPPGSWETGTQSFESMAGVTAAVDYLAEVGAGSGDRRSRLGESYDRIGTHEAALGDRFLAGIAELPHIKLYGSRGPTPRVTTFAVAIEGVPTAAAHAHLGEQGIYTWAGHYYALEIMERLGFRDEGLLRIGFVHYNTLAEVDRVLEALGGLRHET